MPEPASEDPPPPLISRWLRPTSASAILELPTAPVAPSTNPKDDVTWQAFTADESTECEGAWQNLSEEERQRIEDGFIHDDSRRTSADLDDDDDEDTVGVSIAKDKLFEVDVKRWSVSIRPIFTLDCLADVLHIASPHLLENECSRDQGYAGDMVL